MRVVEGNLRYHLKQQDWHKRVWNLLEQLLVSKLTTRKEEVKGEKQFLFEKASRERSHNEKAQPVFLTQLHMLRKYSITH